jgi:biotin carboxyl carrier protein
VSHEVSLENTAGGFAIMMRGDRFDIDLKDAVKGAVLGRAASTGPLKLIAPMPGKIVEVLVAPGDIVEAGQGVLIMEAMKMENELKTTRAGRVQEITVKEGQAVEMGALLIIIG